MSRTDLVKWTMFLGGSVTYVIFSQVRPTLSEGIIRNSLPSLLFLPVTLPLVDLASHRWSEHPINRWLAIAISVFVFELLAPALSVRYTAELFDAVGLIVGGVGYGIGLRLGAEEL